MDCAWRGARILMRLDVGSIIAVAISISCSVGAPGGGGGDAVGGGHSSGGSERCGSLVVVVARMAHVQPRCPTMIPIPSVTPIGGGTARAAPQHISKRLSGAQG